MNHPKHEEWVPYLFGETKPEVRRQLKEHLRDCADCRNEIESWQRSLGRLNAWKLPPTPRAVLTFAPILNWAAAAALVLLVGFGAGRLTAAKADVAKVRAALAPELRRELSQEFARYLHDELERSSSPPWLQPASKRTRRCRSWPRRCRRSGPMTTAPSVTLSTSWNRKV